MEEKKPMQTEFVFVNRNVGVSKSEVSDSMNQETPITEKIRKERKAISLKGEAFVLAFQIVFCLLLILAMTAVGSRGERFTTQISEGYRKITEWKQLNIPAYFTPIAESDGGEAEVESAVSTVSKVDSESSSVSQS